MLRTPRGPARAASLLLIAAVSWPLLLTAGAAHANGRTAASLGYTVSPYEPAHRAMSATIGVLLSQDGGEHFSWICEQAIGSQGVFDPIVVSTPGAVLAAGSSGLFRSSDAGCNWTEVESFEGAQLTDLTAHPDEPARVLATTALGGSTSGVYRSEDEGQSFTPLMENMEDEFFISVKHAPGDARRIYATSWSSEKGGTLYRSTDGGDTFTPVPFEFQGLRVFRVMAVSAADPAVLVALVHDFENNVDYLLRSTDGGTGFEKIFTRPLPEQNGSLLPTSLGVLLQSDGRTLWLADPFEGVQRSDDLGNTWSAVIEGSPRGPCVSEVAGEVFVCGLHFSDGASLFRVVDEGLGFEPAASFDRLCRADCPADSGVSLGCGPLFATFIDQLGGSDGNCGGAPLPRGNPDGGGGGDAGARDDGGAADGGPQDPGCQSAAGDRAPGGAAVAWLLALAGGLLLWRGGRRPGATRGR